MASQRKPGEPIVIRYPEKMQQEPETEHDGYLLPARLDTRAATQYVLNREYISMYVRMYVCILARMCMYVCVFIYVHACMCVCVHVCMCV